MPDKQLQDAIASAFTSEPADEAEQAIIRWVAERPGITFAELTALRGKQDVSLYLGHVAYRRRQWLKEFRAG
jgi:hypothetical protein